MSTASQELNETEVAVLARALGGAEGQLSRDLARSVLEVRISDQDRARVHDLTARNQDDALTTTGSNSANR